MLIPNDPKGAADEPLRADPVQTPMDRRSLDPETISSLRCKINNPLMAIVAEAQLITTSDEALLYPELRAAADRIAALSHRIARVLRELEGHTEAP